MAQYTIEDIEILRKKSGITYEEAVNLLEYHNGSLARALVDLEKNGRMKPEAGASGGSAGHTGAKGLFTYLYRLRFQVRKQDVSIVNVSVLFMLLVLLTAPHILIIGLIVALLLGYRMTAERNSRDFSSDTLDSMLKNAKTNVQSTVETISKQFGAQEGAAAGKADEAAKPQTPRADTPASGTKPVNVQFPGGATVDVREDGDGYHEADIQ